MDRLKIDQFLEEQGRGTLVFDVRTPAEFAKGHIPGAVNLPLLTNDERVVVGTTYKQQGRHPAILEGLDFIGPKMRAMIEDVEKHVGPPGAAVLVHCWRGGMRSGSVAWLLELYGYSVSVLDKGYKSFRHWALAQFEEPLPYLVLGGHTGGGKTEVLDALHAIGEATVDLEGLANHRGSAFGALGLPEQPTQEHFENMLATEFARVRAMRQTVWVEDEGRMVGIRHLPNPVLEQIRRAHVIAVAASFDARTRRLVRVYGEADKDALQMCFNKIRKRLGNERADAAIAFVHEGDLDAAARLALKYYDKCYDHGLERREDGTVHIMDVEDRAPADIARMAIATAESLGIYQEEL